MVYQTFSIPSLGWAVKVFYEVGRNDADRVMRTLDAMGFGGQDLTRAERVLRRARPNTGFTISSSDLKCSVVVMCVTTSAEQFANTFDHEKRHLTIYIADGCGIDVHGEEYACLAGAIAQKMFGVGRRFMCDCCRWKQ